MALERGFGLYNAEGRIVFAYDWTIRDVPNPAIGTLLFDWFANGEREKMRTAYARAMIGFPLPADTVRMNKTLTIRHLACLVRFIPTRLKDAPVCGVFTAYSPDVLSMTPRERDVAKLIPKLGTKQIASQLGITVSTVNTMKQRMKNRLGLSGPLLNAALIDLADVL